MPSPRPPSGLSVRQERFCHAYLRTGVAASAAVEAGYAVLSCVNQGYRLLQRADVQARIAAIQAELARVACDGTDVLLGKLETVYRQAVADRHYTAATRAVDLQARILRQDRLDRLRLAEIEDAASDGSGCELPTSHHVPPTQPSPMKGEGLRSDDFLLPPPCVGEGWDGGDPAVATGSDDLGSSRDRVEAAMQSDDTGSSSDREREPARADGFSPPTSAVVGERPRLPRRPLEGARTPPRVRHTRFGIRASSAREIRGADGPRHQPVPD